VVVSSDVVAPSGVSFVTPSSYESGLSLGDLPPGTGRVLWIRQSADAEGAVPATDGVKIIIETA
jgi:hypothetical protein